jgi:hypothetical protein
VIKNIGRVYATDSTAMCSLQKPGLHKPGFFIVRHKEKEVNDGNRTCFKDTVVADKAGAFYLQQNK